MAGENQPCKETSRDEEIAPRSGLLLRMTSLWLDLLRLTLNKWCLDGVHGDSGLCCAGWRDSSIRAYR